MEKAFISGAALLGDVTETERLWLYRLSFEEMELLCMPGGGAALEKKLGLLVSHREEHPEGFFRRYIAAGKSAGKEGRWFRLWEMVLKEENRRIGGILFKGPPDQAGRVEIGYGLDEPYRGRGFAREGVAALVCRTLQQPEVLAVLAKIGHKNFASQRVAQSVGMSLARWEGFLQCWEILAPGKTGDLGEKAQAFGAIELSPKDYDVR